MTNTPIFYDPTGRRSARVSWLGWIVAISTTVMGVAFFAALLTVPQLSDIGGGSRLYRKAAVPALVKPAAELAATVRAQLREIRALPNNQFRRGGRSKPALSRRGPDTPLTMAFYANWDENSFAALKRALPRLDWVLPTWLGLSGTSLRIEERVDAKGLAAVRTGKPDLVILPVLQNAQNGVWDGPGLARFLASAEARAGVTHDLLAFLKKHKLAGVTIDFENVPKGAHANLELFLQELQKAFEGGNFVVALAVPFDDNDWDYKTYADLADYMILMAYDEHDETGSAGSIAGQTWFERILDRRFSELDPDRTIIGIGNYGYDWHGNQNADDLTFQETLLMARDSEADINFDPSSENPHFSVVEDNGSVHNVWFLDAVTAFNQIHSSDNFQPLGYALWRLGSEDPSLWSVLGRRYRAPAPESLRRITPGPDIDFQGLGEILRIEAEPANGERAIEIETASGDIVEETYLSLATPYVIRRRTARPNAIALTFDDGPDPRWTPQILDILKAKNVKATFFIIGQNAESYPSLVSRALAEGHDIGNHSYTHPNLGQMPSGLVRFELNATQRLFQAISGRSMRLFRPPYFGDAEPSTADEIDPIKIAQAMGYVTVGLHVDPDDWLRPSADLIVSRVLSQLADPEPDARGQIVLLHDSGGDRSHTVAALPTLIDALRAKGYPLVPVSELAGLNRDQAMPPLDSSLLAQMAYRPVFATLGLSGHLFGALFTAAIVLCFARLIMLGGLASWQRWGTSFPAPPPTVQALEVAVLVPAFNEAKVIASSIERLLASEGVTLRVVVIDDGSSDGTGELVRFTFRADRRVTVVSTLNEGKARALNAGVARTKSDLIVALDADTQFQPDTIAKLTRWFADPRVGAVAGNAKVGNRVNVVTYWQTLEYITAQNLERRALAALDCVTVVPGAVGAWRRAALECVGGFPTDTLAEDQDLTISIQKAGYQVRFDADAIAWTEAPETLRGLARQRFRWAFGTLQCLWKHNDVLLRPRYRTLGLFALPQTWLFQIVLPLLSPLVDLMLAWQIMASAINMLQHGNQVDTAILQLQSAYYAAFIAADTSLALLAFSMERERWRLLWWLALQRFGYRQLMYYVVIRSCVRAIRGSLVTWDRLERKASVSTSTLP